MTLLLLALMGCDPPPKPDPLDDDTASDSGFAPARATETHTADEAVGALEYSELGWGPLSGVSFTGDLDGDSEDDILAWDAVDNEEISVHPRDLSGTIDPRSGVLLISLVEDTLGERFATPSAAADLDCDGQSDLVLPYPATAGGVWIVYGALSETQTLEPDALVTGESGSGARLDAQADDVTGDGISDLLVGMLWPGTTMPAGVRVIDGPVDGDRTLADALSVVEVDEGSQRTSWTIDDIDGDGHPEILIGGYTAQYDSDGGQRELAGGWLLPVPTSGSVSTLDASATIVDQSIDGGTYAGRAVELPGDVDGDGKGDLLIGGWLTDGGGAVWLIHGAPSGTIDVSEADATLYGGTFCAEAGYDLASAGDTDGDGFADFWVGAPGEDYDRECYGDGRAWLVRGPIEGKFLLPGSDLAIEGEGGFGSMLSAHPSDGGLLVGRVNGTGTFSLFETADW